MMHQLETAADEELGGLDAVAAEAAEHNTEARARVQTALHSEEHIHGSGYLADGVGGACQGIVATLILGTLLWAAGMEPGSLIAVLLGFGLTTGLAAGLSSAATAAAQVRFYESEIERESEEIRENPEWEQAELRAMYQAKGFRGEILEEIVETLSADEDRLLKVMLQEELGMFLEHFDHPVLIGLAAGASTAVGAALVAATLLLPLGEVGPPVAAGVGLVALVGLAAFRARRTEQHTWRAMLAAFFVAAIPMTTAFWLGQLIRPWLGR